MKAALYVRVSTRQQDTAMQITDLRNYATSRNFEISREYDDSGFSGTTKSRPALDELMADLRKRKFDAVIVWRFDRLARSTRHLLEFMEECRNLGVQFISYQENIDTSGPLGQAIFTMISAVAQLERDLIRERVTAGVQKAIRERGAWGRKSQTINLSEVQGLSVRKAAEILGVSREKVRVARKALR